MQITPVGSATRFLESGATATYQASDAAGQVTWLVSGPVQIIGKADQSQVVLRASGTGEAELVASSGGQTSSLQLLVIDLALRASVTATPALTDRMGNTPADYEIVVDQPPQTPANFDPDSTLVLLSGGPSIDLQALVSPSNAPLHWSVEQASDDWNVAAKTLPGLEVDADDPSRAVLSLDAAGSFWVHSRVGPDPGGPCRTLGLVLVQVTRVQDLSFANSESVTASVDRRRRLFLLSTGGYDQFSPDSPALLMDAVVDLASGGPDGTRLLGRVFAGWISNIVQPEAVRAVYSDGSQLSPDFVSNPNDASQSLQGSPLFAPGDPAPESVSLPLLDCGRPRPGVGGASATLSTSLEARAQIQPAIGQRRYISAMLSPSDSIPQRSPVPSSGRPIQPGRLAQYHFEQEYRAALCLWTDSSGEPGANAEPASRRYGLILDFDWKVSGDWSFCRPRVTTIASPTVVKQPTAHHLPPVSPSSRSVEVRWPSSRNLLAFAAASPKPSTQKTP